MSASVLTLRDKVFSQVDAFTAQLGEGSVDLAPVEASIRTYCEAISALPKEDARTHAGDLLQLEGKMRKLREALEYNRREIMQHLGTLTSHRRANTAYRKSDGIGEVYQPPEEGDL